MGYLPVLSSSVAIAIFLVTSFLFVIIQSRRRKQAKQQQPLVTWDKLIQQGVQIAPASVLATVGSGDSGNTPIKSGSTPKTSDWGPWDDLVLVGRVIKKVQYGDMEIKKNETNYNVQRCLEACHLNPECSHVEVKDNVCILKNRAPAVLNQMLGNQLEPMDECNSNFKCADGYDKGRKLFLHPQVFPLDNTPDPSAEFPKTNRQAMNDFQALFKDMNSKLNPPKWRQILSIFLTVAGVVLSVVGMAWAAPAVVALDLGIMAADIGFTINNTVTNIKDSKKFKESVDNFKKTPKDMPILIYHNMPQEDKKKFEDAKTCNEVAHHVRSWCDKKQESDLQKGDKQKYQYQREVMERVPYYKEEPGQPKRRSTCCKYYHDNQFASGQCDDIYDPSSRGCSFTAYKKAAKGWEELRKSAAWFKRPEAQDNFSPTMGDFFTQFEQMIGPEGANTK